MSEALVKKIKEIQRGLRDGVYRTEKSVGSQIVVPILEMLKWPTGSIQEEYHVGRKLADIALILPRHSNPSILLELKNVGKVDEAREQLFNYCVQESPTEFGVTTDGASWRFHLPLKTKGNREVRRVNLTPDSIDSAEEVARCLTHYLAFSRVKSGDALKAAKKDYEKKLREDELAREKQAQIDALRGEIPEILNDVIIDNLHPEIFKILVRECRKRIKSPLRKDVVGEVLRTLEQPKWNWRATPHEERDGTGKNKEPWPEKSGRRRTVVVGKWQKDFRNATEAQVAFLNALEREFGMEILHKLSVLPSYKGTKIRRLASIRDGIAERKNPAWKQSTKLECGWWLCTKTNNLGKDEMAERAIEVTQQMNPDLRVEWRPTDGEIQPENGDKPANPTKTGRAKVRIVVGDDIDENYTSGARALVALFQAAWNTFGQEVFEELLEQEAQKRGRPWLARSKKEFGLTGKYESSAKEVAPGWWINTNLKFSDQTQFANKLITITSGTHPEIKVKWEPK